MQTLAQKKAQRKYRLKNPHRYVYLNSKHNAKKRNIEFTLSYEDFLEEISGTLYILHRGIKPYNLTLDRKDETKGYVKGNIQVIPNKDNLKKRQDFYRQLNSMDCSDLPF